MYTIRLIPCTTSPTQEYSLPVVCNPRDIINFDLPLRFQQVSDPVPAEFSLNTQFMLLGKEMLWLSDGSMGFGEGTDTAFSPGGFKILSLTFKGFGVLDSPLIPDLEPPRLVVALLLSRKF